MSARCQEAYFLGAMDLSTIGAGIEPAFFGVACHAVGACADVTSAIIFMPDRCRKLADVNIVAGQDILENGSIIDDLVFDDFRVDEIIFAIGVGKLPFS